MKLLTFIYNNDKGRTFYIKKDKYENIKHIYLFIYALVRSSNALLLFKIIRYFN